MKILKMWVVAILVMAAGFTANAQLTGTQIIEKTYDRATGDDQTSALTMTLTNKSGQTRVRKIQQFSKGHGIAGPYSCME